MSGTEATRQEEALWLLERMIPGVPMNNLSLAFRVGGRLDPEMIRASLNILVARHRALRTVFHADDVRLAKTVDEHAHVPITTMECAEDRAPDLLSEFLARPFALDGRALIRTLHLCCAESDYLCIAVHHLIFDTISGAVLLDEFAACYSALAAGRDAPDELRSPAPAIAAKGPGAADIAFWREQLRGFDAEGVELRVGAAEPAAPTLRGGQVRHVLSGAAHAAVKRLRRELRAPEAVVLLAAYCLLLARHGAGPDLLVGSPVSTRGPKEQRAVGYHVNVLPLRVNVDPAESFEVLTRQVRDVFFNALAHAGVSVDVLVDESPRRGSSWHNPLFRHVFNYVPGIELKPFELTGRAAEPIVVENGYSKFDLEFFVVSAAEEIGVRAAYGVEVFSRAEVVELLRRYDHLLVTLGDRAAAPSGTVDVLSPTDRSIVDAANDTSADSGMANVLEAIRDQAATHPDATALETDAGRSSYAELWHAARVMAARLAAAGVRRGDVVALLGPRGPELAAAALGSWLVGAAYLPLDPNHPEERLRYQLEDSEAAAVLAADPAALPEGAGGTVLALGSVADPLPPGVPEHSGPSAAVDEDCAYLIYTSGSTGLPKGTLVGHRALANLVAHFARALPESAVRSMLWLTTFSFDISALELFVPLVRGGRVVVAPDQARTDGAALAEVVVRHRVETVQATPTTWRLVLGTAGEVLADRVVLCGGEPLPRDLAGLLAASAKEVWNVYGPTETTIWSTAGRVTEASALRVDVGRPIANTRVFVADGEGRELPVGVRGELCIAGDGMALDYHRRPELTAQRFRRHPRYGRYYRTGDVARWLPGGVLEVLGRDDRQVKLHGNRIELSEVEAVLRAAQEAKAVAVVVAPGGESLAAFLEGVEEPGAAERLWEHARARLPLAVVPGRYVFVDSFPMTGNDKVDYPALARLAESGHGPGADSLGQEIEEPSDELTAQLVGLWRAALEREDAGRRMNFFAGGGHSLGAAVLAQRVEQATGIRTQMADVFAHPTPERLAAHLREVAADGVVPGPGATEGGTDR